MVRPKARRSATRPRSAAWRTPNGSRRLSACSRNRRPAATPSSVVPSTMPKTSSPSSRLLRRKNRARSLQRQRTPRPLDHARRARRKSDARPVGAARSRKTVPSVVPGATAKVARRPARVCRIGHGRGALVEAQLRQSEAPVVVLPEEVFEAVVEQRHPVEDAVAVDVCVAARALPARARRRPARDALPNEPFHNSVTARSSPWRRSMLEPAR
jgi:hypothetical protein